MATAQLKILIAITTLVFLVMPAFLVVYMFIYNKRKKNHLLEKAGMKEAFEKEIVLTQQEVREQTMQTIGTDLHDNIGQLLSLTSVTLKSIEPNSDKKTKAKVETSIEILTKAIGEMRQLGKLIQGDQLIGLGLEKAIEQEIEWLTKLDTHHIQFTSKLFTNYLPNPSKDLFCFRILQEILNNTIKHANAKVITIGLTSNQHELQLTVSDDGIGFNQDLVKIGGSGLANIQKRANIIGGKANIESNASKGTHITITIPYP